MNFSKPIPEVERELARKVGRILKKATRPEQCARWFTNLDRIHPDIHELIDRIQRATGNDRYFCMLDTYSYLTKASIPHELYRGYFKSDSPLYRFDVRELEQEEHQEESRPRFHR